MGKEQITKKEFMKELKEIENLRRKYKLSSVEVLILRVGLILKYNKFDYVKYKEVLKRQGKKRNQIKLTDLW